MASPERATRLGVDLLVVLLLSATFLVAFSMFTPSPVLAAPGDPVLSGQVTDNVTSLPVANALVHVQGNLVPFINETFTDINGTYSMNLPVGDYLVGIAHGNYYLFLDSSLMIVGDTVVDAALIPAPPRSARVRGNVTDSSTSGPVTTGLMLALTPPMMEPDYVNFSALDGSGAYDMAIIPGDYLLQSDVRGYITNQTLFTIGSGETLWIDMILNPFPPENSTIQGYVMEEGTGLSLPNATISASVPGYGNATTTNETGYYTINVFEGSWQLQASASGFSTVNREVFISADETRWENFTLMETNSTVKGYITDQETDLGIEGATIYLSDMESYTNATQTNSSGYYEMRTIAGTMVLQAFQAGYLSNLSFFSIADGETRWVNLTLRPEDAVLKGYVNETGTGAPLAGVSVQLGMPPFSGNTTLSDGTGYYEIGFGSGPVEMSAYLPGYLSFLTDIDMVPGVNWFNFTMYPELPDNAVVQGYVNSSGPIIGAMVTAQGYGEWTNMTFTNSTGFFAMNVVPAPQTLFTRASNYAPNWTAFTVGAGETLWINVTLAVDPIAPNVTALDASPSVNVSVNNPTAVTGSINESYLDQVAISVLALHNESGGLRNFSLLATFSERDYTLVESSPGLWNLDLAWNAKIPGGRIGNASFREWIPTFGEFPFFPWDVVMGQYQNSSLPSPVQAMAMFSRVTGELELMSISGPPEAVPTDPTGMFQTVLTIFTLDASDNPIGGPPGQLYGTWFPILELDFVRDDRVESVTHGLWLQAWDYADHYSQRWSFLDVDNTPPVADAGPDQAILKTQTVDFDGTGSTDNIGLTEYTWSFQDGGTVILTGPTPSHTFNTAGNFEITLEVTDGAMNTDTDIMWVNVTADAEPPVADAGPDQTVDEDTVVAFDGSGSTDNIGIVNYTWDFVDATSQTLYGVSPSYMFANPGTFVVTLTATDAEANSDTDTVTITVRDTTDPVADAGTDMTVVEDVQVAFDGTGSSDNVGVVNYTWDFGDGTTGYGGTTTHTYSDPGGYTVTLTVRDAAGNEATDALEVTVQLDTDGDGDPDATDADDDGDGMPDDWEEAHGLDPLDPTDATTDLDGDGVNNLDEYRAGTDPNRPAWMDWVIYGGIAAAVGVVGIVAFLIWRRRK